MSTTNALLSDVEIRRAKRWAQELMVWIHEREARGAVTDNERRLVAATRQADYAEFRNSKKTRAFRNVIWREIALIDETYAEIAERLEKAA